MSTNTKANAELELRPLEDHELKIVSGGGIPVDTPMGLGAWGGPMFGMDLYFFGVAPNRGK